MFNSRFKIKKLDNKGFTLIELLAVVVILAIVMGIAGTSIINSINNSRKSTLHSAAQTAANNLNIWAMEDSLVVNDSERKLGDNFENTTLAKNDGVWKCISNDMTINNNVNLLSALGIASADIVISGNEPKLDGGKYTITSGDDTGTCSAIRYNKNAGAYEVLLVARTNGKYYVSSDGTGKNYAFSRATSYNTSITD